LKKKHLIIAAIFALLASNVPKKLYAQTKPLSNQKISYIFSLEKKYLENAWDSVRITGKLPRSTQRGYKPITDWTAGFYPGSLWFVYEFTKDKSVLKKAQYATALLEADKDFSNDHDIGFLMYCSYGNGYRLTKDASYKDILIHSSKTAITRYHPKVKAIMSWNPNPERDWKFPVIIDNMMNLEMLLETTQWTGDSTYYHVAVNHANTTLKNQYRDDFSCSHVVDYDPQTGEMRKRDWNNGNNDPKTAAWSRGQSWGLYGFTFMYRYTRNEKYLHHAENIAAYVLNHPNMPKDMVPYWDYNAPNTPTMRDASAAALLASGLLELSTLSNKNGLKYFKSAERILVSLSSPAYLNTTGKGIFLLKHATGNFVQKSELDAGLMYADYYFLEALLRYQQLKQKFN